MYIWQQDFTDTLLDWKKKYTNRQTENTRNSNEDISGKEIFKT